MSTLSSTQLLEWLRSQQFLTPAQAEEMRALLPRFPDAHALARDLLQRGWLTPYQANQILQGRGDSLVLGGYRLLERLGEGAMGQVFKAWNLRMQRVVALKMILKDHVASGKAMARFRREMETAARLDHPNIVLVRDADEAEGRPFIVMDYIEGIDLSALVKQQGPLPPQVAAEYARQAALGLQHAGERGVVHRDIKPGNLFLLRGADGSDLIKILDFGLARFDSENQQGNRLTQVGNVILGTVDYMAPEQAENARTADIRADVYALGCTLFYLLTGKAPFPGSTIVEKLSARLLGPVPSVAALRGDVPAGLEAVVRKMMARNPADRYQTPQEAAAALQPFCLTQGVPSVPPGTLRAEVVVPAGQVTSTMAPGGPGPGVDPAGRPLARLASPLAVPVIAGSVAPAPTAGDHQPDPFAFSHPGTTSPSPGPTAAPAAAPAVPRGPGLVQVLGQKVQHLLADPVRRRYCLIGLGTGLLLLILLVVLLSGGSTPPLQKRGYFHPNAALKLGPFEPLVLKEGGVKNRIVTVERQFFKGPVTVKLVDPPEGVSAAKITIPADKDKAEFWITVSFNTDALDTELKVEAIAENLRAEGRLPLKFTPAAQPKKKRTRPFE